MPSKSIQNPCCHKWHGFLLSHAWLIFLFFTSWEPTILPSIPTDRCLPKIASLLLQPPEGIWGYPQFWFKSKLCRSPCYPFSLFPMLSCILQWWGYWCQPSFKEASINKAKGMGENHGEGIAYNFPEEEKMSPNMISVKSMQTYYELWNILLYFKNYTFFIKIKN